MGEEGGGGFGVRRGCDVCFYATKHCIYTWEEEIVVMGRFAAVVGACCSDLAKGIGGGVLEVTDNRLVS